MARTDPNLDLKSGERRTAAILFADMTGSTALSERSDPEELDAVISRVFSGFQAIVERHGGFVEKYIGDALVAVFGVPEVHEDDSARALGAALEFLEHAEAINRDRKPGAAPLSFRIGVNAGLVATGRRGDYEVVTGHAMNVAQRLQAEAEPGAVLVSEAVREKCAGDFRFGKRQAVKLRGGTQSVHAYELLGRALGEPIPDSGPFVGRKDLLDLMMRDYLRNSYDEVSGVYLLGDPGIGKTRVAQAFAEKIRRFPDFASPVLRSRAWKYRAQRYAVVVDLLLDYLDFEADADPAAAEAELRSRLGVPEPAARAFAALALRRDPTREAGIVSALHAIFEAILEKHEKDVFPILVVVDNAPDMDRGSRDFFEYFFKRCRIKPFFVLTGRDHPAFLKDIFGGLKVAKVEPLGEAESRELVGRLWPDAREEAVPTVLAAGMGNPLFLREYVRWARSNRDAAALPVTVQNIYLASLDKYSHEQRDFLKKMSVFLHSFTLKDALYVQDKTDGPASVVQGALDLFVKEGVLLKQGDLYLFRLDVYKKALYDSLLNYNKKILHGIVARLIEYQKKPNRARLLHHLIKAEEYLRALEAMQADSRRTYNYEYLPYIEVLLKHIGKEDYRSVVSCLITKSALLFNSGKIEEADHVLNRILSIALERRDLKCAGFAYHQLTAYNLISGDYRKTRFCGMAALRYYHASGNEGVGMRDVLRLSSVAASLEADDEAADALLGRMAAHPGRSLESDEADLALARAECLVIRGDYPGALRCLRDLPSMEEDEVPLFFRLDVEVRALWELCDFAALKEPARRFRRLGVLSEATLAQVNARLAAACALSGEEGRSDDYFAQAEFFLGQIRNDFDRVESLRALALARRCCGNDAAAAAAAREGLALALRHSAWYASATLLAVLAETAERRVREGAADRAAARAAEEELRFLLDQFALVAEAGVALPRKDLVVFRWLLWKRAISDPGAPEGEAEALRAAAEAELEREAARLQDPGRIASFLSIRSFGRIKEELDSAAART